MSNIFEKATRSKLRFDSPIGKLSVEELWDLPLQTVVPNKPSLDAIALELDERINSRKPTTFVKSRSKLTALQVEDQLKFEIVTHIIDVIEAENAAKVESKVKESKIAVIKEAIAAKELSNIQSKTLEELQAELAAVQNS